MKTSLPLIHQPLLDACADRLHVSTELLIETITQTNIYDTASINQLLYMANRYQLDPLANEIILIEHKDAKAQAWITVDGWFRILHQQAHFSGLQFREAPTVIGAAPEWMECTIYRDDKILPFVVKEYLDEIQQEYAVYHTMPKRMLRHKTLQQTIRLAFGISTPPYNHQTQPGLADPLLISQPPLPREAESHASKTAQLKDYLKPQSKE